MVGSEACDDGLGTACLDDCSGPFPGYKCLSNVCSPIYGDGLVIGIEQCDAGSLEGCDATCSSNLMNYSCQVGNSTSPSICTEIINQSSSQIKDTKTTIITGTVLVGAF